MESLQMDIKFIKGVGPKRKKQLNKLGVRTLEDLFYYIPREYDDRSLFKKINDCSDGDKASFKLKIIDKPIVLRPRRNMSILKIPVTDGHTNAYLTWFNQEYLKNQLIAGKTYLVNGIKQRRAGEIQISNPIFEEEGRGNLIGKIMPIYSLTEGLTNNILSKILKKAFEDYGYLLEEFIPSKIVDKYGLMDIKKALKNIHFPENLDIFIRARNRVVLEELITLQLGLYTIKNRNTSERVGLVFKEDNRVLEFIKLLPFQLTDAQKRVYKEISEDMNNNKNMNRLIQGDVGSGKTVIALMSMLRAISSGYQATMMAPTEILASQHYESITNFLKGMDIRVDLLVGSLKKKEKEKVLEKLKSGETDILIGTHAIIQEGVYFNKLGIAVTDEQHRFGVKQRSALSDKGLNPDVLVMTATPIPRTLALILYGDLDISIIDELPPGRKEIETFSVGFNIMDRINGFIKKQLNGGRQAYIVCPLIEENEKMSINSAEEVYKSLKENEFKEYKLGLLHGQMKTKEKDEVMNAFKLGDLDILVSTTVIEVGVDVPNSNTMIIYNAERFGLAQLHQLRGRVGRGEYQSYCILLNDSNTQISRERMRIMQNSSDGFVISEKDLELRGPGEFFGTKQHGLPELRVANLFRDMKILKLAQKESDRIIQSDPFLQDHDNLKIKNKIKEKFRTIKDISFN